MASNENKLKDALRNSYLELISEKLTANGDEVLRTGSNEIALPCTDDEHNDRWIVITVKVPNGTRDGEAYDGYEEAQGYADKVAEKAEKAKAKAEAKAKKIASDKAAREAKAKAKAEKGE